MVKIKDSNENEPKSTGNFRKHGVQKTSQFIEGNEPEVEEELPCILYLCRTVLKVMRKFGSSRLTVVEGEWKPKYRLETAKDFGTNLLYYATKVFSLVHFIFFIVRFINTLSHEKDMRISQLTIAPYILSIIMMWGIYLLTHFRESRICQFFNQLNELDGVIFGDGK